MAIEISTSIEIAAGQTVSFVDPPKYVVNDFYADRPAYVFNKSFLAPVVFTNHGTVELTLNLPGYAYGFGIARTSGTSEGDLFFNAADGVFQVLSTYDYAPTDSSAARAFYAPQQSISVRNDGWIEVTSLHGNADGIETWDSYSSITNNGTIRVRGQLDVTGIDRPNGGYVTNTGLLRVDSGIWAVAVDYGQYYYGFNNSGTIIARTAKESPYPSFGVYVGISLEAAIPGQTYYTYLNSGTISADYAFWINPGYGLASLTRSREELDNSGEIDGAINLAYGDDLLRNSGVINSFTDLGEGNDVYDGSAGQHHGVLGAGVGADTVLGGEGAEVFFGELGTDLVRAGAGDDFVDGGRGSDALDGGTGFDTISYLQSNGAVSVNLATGHADSADHDLVRNFEAVIGSDFADLLQGSDKSEVLEGAGGNDSITGGDGNDSLLGDQGADTLAGGAGADQFVFSAGDGRDQVADFSAADALRIYGFASYQSLQQVGDDSLLTLSATDSILLRHVLLADIAPGQLQFSSIPLQAAPVPQIATSQIVSYDLVIQSGEELRFVNPQPRFIQYSYFENTGLVFETLPHTAQPSIFNAGTLYVEGSSAARVRGTYWEIADTGSYFGSAHVVNLASGVIDVVSTGSADALGIYAPEDSWNFGQVMATSAGGAGLGVEFHGFRQSFVNGGSIVVHAARDGLGLLSEYDSSLWSSGSIEVRGGSPSVGVRWSGASYSNTPMVFANSGSIHVSNSQGVSGSIGLSFAANVGAPLIWNSGVIEADYAIRLVPYTTPEPAIGSNIYNSGALRGQVALARGTDILLNTGSINGLIALGEGNDVYDGRSGTQQGGVHGDDGDDLLLAGADADALDGGAGNDTLGGGSGNDTLTGGSGLDSFRFEAGSGADAITDFTSAETLLITGYGGYQSLQQLGNDALLVFSAQDQLLLRNVSVASLGQDNFIFSAAAIATQPMPAPPVAPAALATPALPDAPRFADAKGQPGELLHGGPEGDSLFGGSLDDSLDGGLGADSLLGSGGQDTLAGGAGDDVLTGGADPDVFLFAAQGNGVDRIADFSVGDLLRITGANFLGPITLGSGAALGPNGVQLSQVGGNSILFIGTDAVAGADIEIHLDGTRSVSDFVLRGNQISFGPIVIGGKAVNLLAYDWKTHTLLDGVTVDGSGKSAGTGSTGSASLAAITDDVLALSVTRSVSTGESAATAGAVNLQDAVAIMRMIVGLEVNGTGKPLSPYQALSADFDGNGAVSLNDAIGVLRHVVGLSSPEPTWHFANEADLTVPGKAGLNPGAPPAITADLSASSPVHVGLVGYLSGDVDGSFGGTASAQDLDITQPGYFAALVGSHPGLSLAQFGIYAN